MQKVIKRESSRFLRNYPLRSFVVQVLPVWLDIKVQDEPLHQQLPAVTTTRVSRIQQTARVSRIRPSTRIRPTTRISRIRPATRVSRIRPTTRDSSIYTTFNGPCPSQRECNEVLPWDLLHLSGSLLLLPDDHRFVLLALPYFYLGLIIKENIEWKKKLITNVFLRKQN